MKLLNEILGTKYPIIQGGMANIATGEFAAACSNAGALGIIGAGGMNADTLRQNIRRCRELTDKPFGVKMCIRDREYGLSQDVTRLEVADTEQLAFLYQDRISVLLGTLNDLDYVPNTGRQQEMQYALSNSLGFGGHNACIALRRWEG